MQRIPKGLHAVEVHGDGNCLFRSISVALFGTEKYSTLLRLAAVCHGVDHFNHYLDMVRSIRMCVVRL